jgi:Ser/Thr protein kinase RdoA (MazF antagonist)
VSVPASAGVSRRSPRALETADAGEGLPEAFTHPDFALANVVAPPEAGLVVVDWAGAGRAARAWSFAFLLWSVGFGGDLGRVERVSAGYGRRVRPEADELARLEALLRVRPLVFEVWAVCAGRKSPSAAADALERHSVAAAAIAARARSAWVSPESVRRWWPRAAGFSSRPPA